MLSLLNKDVVSPSWSRKHTKKICAETVLEFLLFEQGDGMQSSHEVLNWDTSN